MVITIRAVSVGGGFLFSLESRGIDSNCRTGRYIKKYPLHHAEDLLSNR